MSAPAVLLLPGLMCDAAAFPDAAVPLRELAPRIVVADHGEAYSLASMAEAALAAVPGPLAVVGHSMGGRVALEIARRAPERLRGLALWDTGYRARDAGEAGERERAGRLGLLEQARREGVRAMAAVWVRGMVHPARLDDEVLLGSILDMFERHSVMQFAAQQQALIERPDATALLASIRCPTLVLCGEQDGWSPPAQHREMAVLLPASELCVVPDCGHMSAMERPAAVGEALRGWYQRCLAA